MTEQIKRMDNDKVEDAFMLSALLNVVDSPFGNAGHIVFMTANVAEVIDPALTQPGQLDMQFKLGFCHLTWPRTCLRGYSLPPVKRPRHLLKSKLGSVHVSLLANFRPRHFLELRFKYTSFTMSKLPNTKTDPSPPSNRKLIKLSHHPINPYYHPSHYGFSAAKCAHSLRCLLLG
jgi:hypothetical protein